MIWKTAKLNTAISLMLALPVVLFPEVVLSPLLFQANESLLLDAKPLLLELFVILGLFSMGAVFFSGVDWNWFICTRASDSICPYRRISWLCVYGNPLFKVGIRMDLDVRGDLLVVDFIRQLDISKEKQLG